MAQITKYAIKLERIKIIQFCLKIWDCYTFLHLFTLGLVCRWGVVQSQIAFYTFRPKKVHVLCSCEPPSENFPVFTLESDRPCSDWQLMILDLLTHLWPFEITAEMKTKCKIWLKCQFLHRTINHNAPLDVLICPLQIINWHHSWCKHTLYPPPIQCPKLLDRP